MNPACRFCDAALRREVVDLGMSPPSNAFVSPEHAGEPETFYPLRLLACERCGLVQLPNYRRPEETFDHYPYMSSFSTSWLDHVSRYADMMRERLTLTAKSFVVEIASNDGHLLKNFSNAGVPVLGIEPARNIAAAAVAAGIPTRAAYFGATLAGDLAAEGKRADLIVANNVLAHVPGLNDFVAGIGALLEPLGVATLEFPHLAQLIANTEFDTIYHEHLSYFSLSTAQEIFAAHGLRIFDVEELSTHGGSLRIYVAHAASPHADTAAVQRVVTAERAAGLGSDVAYEQFAKRVAAVKRSLLTFLIDAAAHDKRVAGYGAPAKATTLLN
ncbi:MAG: methyltransferase domain-containing protein, partial [Candidatus Eremiobacteraeota bacterium]|nr:methyltransferase domain-containing protein [Candidatus Eremiobacteraeota bacterium]